MKEKMKRLSALAVMMLCAFVFSACGSDDSSSAGGSSSSTLSIVGTWRYYFESNDTSRGRVYNQITFKSDHTGALIEEVGYVSDTPEAFTWAQSGNTITIIWGNGKKETVVIVEVVDNNTIVISNDKGEITLYRQ